MNEGASGREFALNDERDLTRPRARPKFWVAATTPPPCGLFGCIELGLEVSYRKRVARYLGAGEWVIFLASRRVFVHMGEDYDLAVVYLRGFIDCVLGSPSKRSFLRISAVDPSSGGNDQRNAVTSPRVGRDNLQREKQTDTFSAGVV